MRKIKATLIFAVLLSVLCIGCGKKPEPAATTPTIAPTVTPEATEAPTATPEPTATPAPTPTPMGANLPEGITLKNTYGEAFGRIGTCITRSQMINLEAKQQVQAQFNSITMENEMKPDAVLGGGSPKFITVEEAKTAGYVIPANYTEETVPQLKFTSIDDALNFCEKNDLGLRGHTLVWHSQTPSWFFRVDYDKNKEVVSPEVMDARMEFYIRTVMGHVYDHENGERLYAWDVVNEYVHASGAGWKEVYGEEGLNPGFVKKAFEIADDVLNQYGLQDKVSLFYNDYNTYYDTAKVQKLVQFINSEKRICDGVGMQSHLKTNSPSATSFLATVQRFLDDGYEVQITEMDAESTNDTLQAKYYYEIMAGLLEMKKNGANITGITYWGLSDSNSWRSGKKPLLFKVIGVPKLSYYKVLEAYVDSAFYTEE